MGKPDRDRGVERDRAEGHGEQACVWVRGQVLGVWGAECGGSLLAPGDCPSPEVSTK